MKEGYFMMVYAGIVTYNPNEKVLKKNIHSIIDQVDKVLIVDNGSKNVDTLAVWEDLEKIDVIKNQQNFGIARALNQICKYGIRKHYKWVLTLDQDSVSPPKLILNLKKYIASDVAVVAPNIAYKNNEAFTDMTTQGVHEVSWVITSASLTNLQAWQDIGGFDEKLFIDGVDKDFCIRALRKKYRILKNYDVQLLHELGNLHCRRILGRIIYVTNHSAFRKYYMARNAIYLDEKLGLKKSRSYIVKLIMKTLFLEGDKLRKLCAIYRGIRDAYK